MVWNKIGHHPQREAFRKLAGVIRTQQQKIGKTHNITKTKTPANHHLRLDQQIYRQSRKTVVSFHHLTAPLAARLFTRLK